MIPIVTLTQAKQHLRLPLDVTLDDDALDVLLEVAHGLVRDKCKSYCGDPVTAADAIAAAYAAVDAWTADTAPPGVRAAILQTIADLDLDRNTLRDTAPRYHSLSPRAEGFLALVRDPVLR